MRTPWFTVLAPFVSIGLFAAALATDHWIEWEEGNAKAHAGVLRYKYTQQPKLTHHHGDQLKGETEMAGWMIMTKDGFECEHTSDEGKCTGFRRVLIALLCLTGMSVLLQFVGWCKATCGAGIAVTQFFWSTVFGAVPCILFAATYERARLPNVMNYPTVSPSTAPTASNTSPEDEYPDLAAGSDEYPDLAAGSDARQAHALAAKFISSQVQSGAFGDVSDTGSASVGALSWTDESKATLQWSYFLFIGGAVVTLVILIHHLATYSKRKFEEL